MSEAIYQRRNSDQGRRRRTRVSAELAALIAATAGALGSFGLVISGIWIIHIATN